MQALGRDFLRERAAANIPVEFSFYGKLGEKAWGRDADQALAPALCAPV
jgi:hypothetical protein